MVFDSEWEMKDNESSSATLSKGFLFRTVTQPISSLVLLTHSSCPPQLDIMEPKVPDDIYKTHLENNREWMVGCCVYMGRMDPLCLCFFIFVYMHFVWAFFSPKCRSVQFWWEKSVKLLKILPTPVRTAKLLLSFTSPARWITSCHLCSVCLLHSTSFFKSYFSFPGTLLLYYFCMRTWILSGHLGSDPFTPHYW